MGTKLASLLLVCLCVAGCAPSEQQQAATKAEIRQLLEAYLERLSEAYATGNVEVLDQYAVEREMAHVTNLVEELAAQGQRIEADLKSLTIEELQVWSHSNAYVTTLEVWDIRTYATGSDRILGEYAEQSNRVKYQLKRKDDRWVVLYRQLQQTFE